MAPDPAVRRTLGPVQAPDTPIRPASTVMLVEDRPDLRVLMVRRHADAVFGPDMWVFPGGRVDDEDESLGPQHLEGEPTSPLGDLAVDHPMSFVGAAVREVYEETGLLLATADGSWATPVDADADRAALVAGRPQADLLEERGWRIPAGSLHYVAQWVTPEGPPRRFDARFFVAPAPPHDEVVHDATELVDAEWISPAAALARKDEGRWGLMTPTTRMLRQLARFDSASEVLAVATDPPPWQRARVIPDGTWDYAVLLPGDPGYEDGTEDFERGWVRLYR